MVKRGKRARGKKFQNARLESFSYLEAFKRGAANELA